MSEFQVFTPFCKPKDEETVEVLQTETGEVTRSYFKYNEFHPVPESGGTFKPLAPQPTHWRSINSSN